MRIAGSRDLETFSEPVIIETPKMYADGLRVFVETAKGIAQGEAIEAAAVSFPGLLSSDRRKLVVALAVRLISLYCSRESAL